MYSKKILSESINSFSWNLSDNFITYMRALKSRIDCACLLIVCFHTISLILINLTYIYNFWSHIYIHAAHNEINWVHLVATLFFFDHIATKKKNCTKRLAHTHTPRPAPKNFTFVSLRERAHGTFTFFLAAEIFDYTKWKVFCAKPNIVRSDSYYASTEKPRTKITVIYVWMRDLKRF